MAISRARISTAIAATAVVNLCLLSLAVAPASQTRDSLPESLTDQAFWALTETLSEPGGNFRSNSGSPDNLLSNESTISTVAAALAAQVRPDGVYLGVGPEQNFTYIAAIRPRIAFITDIRRGNLHLHLMYKALFEMSTSRADFVARLFTRVRPPGLTPQTSAGQLLSAYLSAVPGDDKEFATNLAAITGHLTKTRRLPLGADDLSGIEYVLRQFHRFGPAIHYTSSIGGGPRGAGSYATILSAVDRRSREERTFLANEERFAFVKAMQARNLIVPIVGDFAGPKALRAVGAWLEQHSAVVTAFYVSNVEQYLHRGGVWARFCENVAALPLDDHSTFIRPSSSGFGQVGSMMRDAAACR